MDETQHKLSLRSSRAAESARSGDPPRIAIHQRIESSRDTAAGVPHTDKAISPQGAI